MSTPALSVVMPAYNEARHLPATIAALVEAVERSGLDAELVVVDDGSADGSGDVARAAARGRIPVRVLRQENSGRLAARRAGIEAADASLVLLLDGRVRIEAEALRFLAPHGGSGPARLDEPRPRRGRLLVRGVLGTRSRSSPGASTSTTRVRRPSASTSSTTSRRGRRASSRLATYSSRRSTISSHGMPIHAMRTTTRPC